MSAGCVRGTTVPALVVKRKKPNRFRETESTAVLYFLSFRENPTVLFFFNNISSSRAPRHLEPTDLLHSSESAVAAVCYRPRDRFPRHAMTSENRIDRFAVWQHKIPRRKLIFDYFISAVVHHSCSSTVFLAYHLARGFVFISYVICRARIFMQLYSFSFLYFSIFVGNFYPL